MLKQGVLGCPEYYLPNHRWWPRPQSTDRWGALHHEHQNTLSIHSDCQHQQAPDTQNEHTEEAQLTMIYIVLHINCTMQDFVFVGIYFYRHLANSPKNEVVAKVSSCKTFFCKNKFHKNNTQTYQL